MKRNIKINYIYSFFVMFGVTSLWSLYLAHKGMSLMEIGLLESIFHVSSFIFEMPTGAIADTYGRKKALIFGRISSILGFSLMLLGSNFLMFAIAFIFSALSYNFESGTNEAMIYDSLKAVKDEDRYIKVSSNINFIIEITSGIGIIIAGVISDIKFEYIYIVAIIISLFALATAVFFKEPPIERAKSERNTFLGKFKKSFELVKINKEIRYLMVFFAVIFAFGTTTFYYSQNHLSILSFKNSEISLVIFISCVFQAIGATFSPIITEKFSEMQLLVIFSIVKVAFLIFISTFNGIGIVIFFIVNNIVGTIAYPINSFMINRRIPSEERATLISFQSMLVSVVMIVIFPLVGFLGDKLGLRSAFMIEAIIFVMIIIPISVLKYNSDKKNDEL